MEAIKYDQEKPRMDLIPPDALFAIAEVLTYGANKYSGRNWELGMDWGRLFGSLMRHMWSFWMGEDKDKESGYSHLAHAGCCVLMLLSHQSRGIGKDDRFV